MNKKPTQNHLRKTAEQIVENLKDDLDNHGIFPSYTNLADLTTMISIVVHDHIKKMTDMALEEFDARVGGELNDNS